MTPLVLTIVALLATSALALSRAPAWVVLAGVAVTLGLGFWVVGRGWA